MKFGIKSAILLKRFDKKPVYNEEYLRTKIKSYEGKLGTNFHEDKMPKEGSQYIYLSVILTGSVFGTRNSYYN